MKTMSIVNINNNDIISNLESRRKQSEAKGQQQKRWRKEKKKKNIAPKPFTVSC